MVDPVVFKKPLPLTGVLCKHCRFRVDNTTDIDRKLGDNLARYIINGIHTNIPLLRKLLGDKNFIAVTHYTRYLQREFEPPQNDPERAASAAAIILYELEKAESARRYGDLAGFSNTRA